MSVSHGIGTIRQASAHVDQKTAGSLSYNTPSHRHGGSLFASFSD
jgi:hypothetical protein